MTALSVLLLADSRLPNGGHAHSGGIEMAVAAAALLTGDWSRWDRALSARIPSAALRVASRSQGAALLRTVAGMWPLPAGLVALGKPHQPLVLGAATRAGGGDARDAALLAVHHLLAGACSAAVRLLGLDPLAVAAVQASIDPSKIIDDAMAAAEVAVATDDPDLLPAVSGPITELLAAAHTQQEVTLFAS
jgi:urease accessory protein